MSRHVKWVLGGVAGLLSCLVLILIQQLPAKVSGEEASKSLQKEAGSPSGASTVELQARIESLEKELTALKRDGVFVGMLGLSPGANKADSEVIEALQALVEKRLETWRKIYALYVEGAKGGDSLSESIARTRLQLAQAQMAWAQGDDQMASKQLHDARDSAKIMLRAVESSYDNGITNIDGLLEAQKLVFETEVMLYRVSGKSARPRKASSQPWKLPPGPMPKPYPPEELSSPQVENPNLAPAQSPSQPEKKAEGKK